MRFLCLALMAVGQHSTTPDAELKVVPIDSDAREALVSLRADPRGRLFVGGREGLFVYEPKPSGAYEPRKLLVRFPAQSWIHDIETRGNDLYVLTSSALYVIPDGVRKRDKLQPRKLVWGVPREQAQPGFRSLAWGPEGDLYFAMGDPVSYVGDANRPDHWGHWTFFYRAPGAASSIGSSPEGEGRMVYNGVGGVFRCKPDGSALHVVAGGLRHPSGLVFDRYWNLFTSDRGEDGLPGRLLHVTPRAYFGWPRGWMSERTPARSDLLQTLLAGMARADFQAMSYYDDPLLPEKYRHNLLVARRDLQAITRYSIEPRGASFQAREQVLLQCKGRAFPVGITVGVGGRIFAIVATSARDEKSANSPSEIVMITKADDNANSYAVGSEAVEEKLDALWQSLSDPSWQTRYRAHAELMRRGSAVWKDANKRLLTTKVSDPAVHHLLWLAARSQQGSLHLLPLVDHRDPLVRVQAIRALAEFPEQLRDEPIFTRALLDDHPQARHAALLAFFSPRVAWNRPAQQAIERGPAISQDTYLRQAATLLLAEKATRKQREDLCTRFDAPMRLAGVLAIGFRLTMPPVHKALASHLPLARLREPYVIEYADGKLDLRERGRAGSYTVAEHWKADMHTDEQELHFQLLRKMRKDTDASVRAQAAFFLSLLNDPRDR